VDQQGYIISFDGISSAEANFYAEELRDTLLDASADVEVERKRDDPSTQDFGATLALVLGTPAVAIIARALGNWLTLRRKAAITIKTANGEIIGTNLTSQDILKLAELLLEKK
jgi:hypothetical protein